MPIETAIVTAAISAVASYFTAQESSRIQKRAAKKAIAAQEAARQQEIEARQPYVDAGKRALASLETLSEQGPGGPMYEWRRAQAEDAMEKRLRASGEYRSGRAQQLMSGIGQQLTAEETQAHEARLMSLASMGQGGIGAGAVDTQGYYAAGEAEAAPWQQVGQGISTIAGTVGDWREEERKRREWELLRGGGGLTPETVPDRSLRRINPYNRYDPAYVAD